MRPVGNAYVHVIKTKVSGIKLDIVSSTVSLRNISQDQQLNDENLLKSFDLQSLRSLNGC